MAAVKVLLREFVARTQTEEKAVYYDFSVNGDEIFCREAYLGAEGVLAHLTNVRVLLEKMLTLCALTRLEVHGPAAELDKLRGALGGLNPTWFSFECGIKRGAIAQTKMLLAGNPSRRPAWCQLH